MLTKLILTDFTTVYEEKGREKGRVSNDC